MLQSHGEMKKQRINAESAMIPFIIKYPGLLGEKGKNSDFLINTLDILPTMMGMAGLEVPEIFDGENVTDIILGKKEDTRQAALVSCIQPFGQWPRAGGGREFRGVITKKYTYARDLEGEWLLFDNENDPYQMNNLVADESFNDLKTKLDDLLNAELARLEDEFLSGPEYLEKCNIEVDETGTVPYRHK
jgi:arylsulfatase A-like enzyme